MASSLRSAFSLRLRCLRTPAASSISARRASGPAFSTWSSWPWPDDHVHLPAEAGVGEQFLDVEQAALVAVDRVLALAGPEQQPADRDLGVVDRQGAVAVVDGQRDLGPAERRPAGGPGENDVLHLAAAQRLDALLAHDPGERVDHVRLARPVRADDARDPLLEPQRRGRGERLEPAQSEGFQVHLSALLLWGPVPPPGLGRPAGRSPTPASPPVPPIPDRRSGLGRPAAPLVRTLPRGSVSPVDSAGRPRENDPALSSLRAIRRARANAPGAAGGQARGWTEKHAGAGQSAHPPYGTVTKAHTEQ